jgi:hypothetical protein
MRAAQNLEFILDVSSERCFLTLAMHFHITNSAVFLSKLRQVTRPASPVQEYFEKLSNSVLVFDDSGTRPYSSKLDT